MRLPSYEGKQRISIFSKNMFVKLHTISKAPHKVMFDSSDITYKVFRGLNGLGHLKIIII